MKASAEKSSTTTSAPALRTSSEPFFAKAGGGNFFEPVAPTGAPMVQTKMAVNQPGDKFEQEADNMASKVMRMPAPTTSGGQDEKLQRQPEEKIQKAAATEDKLQKKEEDKLQRKSGEGALVVGAGTQSAIHNSATGGQPLSGDARSYMEPRFGADFGNVRIHNDARAAALSDQLSAKAFTYQNNIFFSRDQYQPGTSEGKQLLAHELIHTVQQGHAEMQKAESVPSLQRAPAAVKAPKVLSSEVVDVSANTFTPSEKVHAEIEAQGPKGLGVRIIVKGLTAEGLVTIKVDGSKNYNSIGRGTMPLLNEWTQQLGGMHLNFKVVNSEITDGYASLTTKGGKKDWLEALSKNADHLGGLGLKIKTLPKSPTNKFEAGKLTLKATDLKIQVGGFLDATISLALENTAKPKIEATADINVGGLAKGQLKLDNTQGNLAGEASVALAFKDFSGAAQVKYNADGTVDIGGKGAYNANKLSGEISFVATDSDTANKFATNALAAAGGAANVQNAGPPAPVPVAKPGKDKRGLAATGQLAFHLTTWFAGTVTVVVDGKGEVTVIGKIAPPAEVELFKQKDWDKELIKFEAKAYYGIPVVGNLNLFANISLHALAKLGPAKLYNIEILGTYSTDPTIQKNIQIAASLNISAYAGLRLRAEGGAGVEIADHNLKFGVGVNADVGVKAYADARPTIGYRDPGEFYISGMLEMVAQPMLGLGGEFFIQLKTPWWSPLSDDKWTWPLFSKEWPLSDPIGISVSVKDYVLGSGKVPEVELKQPEFDPSKFMTSMVDKTLPDKSGGPGTGQGSFKEDGSVPKPVVPPKKPAPPKPAAKGGSKKTPPKGGKSAAPDPKAAAQKDATKLLKAAVDRLNALKGKGPFTRTGLDKELAAISGATFDVQAKGDKWVVKPKVGNKTGGKDVKGIDLGKVLEKLGGKDKNERKANIKLTVPFDMNGEGHRLYTEVRDGKLIVEMASFQREELLALTLKAKAQTNNKNAAKRLENVYAKLKVAEGKAKLLISDRDKDAETSALADKMTQDAANTLKGIGNEFGIPSLAIIPHKSEYVESTITGYKIKSIYKSKIRKKFYPPDYDSDTYIWAKDFVKSRIDPKNKNNFIDCEGRSEPIATATIDHQPRVVEHWESAGKNTIQSVRKTWYSKQGGHLSVIAKKYNSKDGAEARNAGLNYSLDNIGKGFLGPGEV